MDDSTHARLGVAPEAELIAAVVRLLEFIDELPAAAMGALRLGNSGMILVQSKKVCWAVASSMHPQLTDLLRNQGTPPLSRAAIETVYRSCKDTGQPLGEALVAKGLLSEAGLRAALLTHIGEAICHLARARQAPDGFFEHARSGYDPRFSFSVCEILASLGAIANAPRAARAQAELDETLVPESSGAAFVRSGSAAGALLIGVSRGCDLPAGELLTACNWATGLFDIAHTFDPTTWLARATWCARTALITWCLADVGYVALCSSRAAAARLMSQLAERGSRRRVGQDVGT